MAKKHIDYITQLPTEYIHCILGCVALLVNDTGCIFVARQARILLKTGVTIIVHEIHIYIKRLCTTMCLSNLY